MKLIPNQITGVEPVWTIFSFLHENTAEDSTNSTKLEKNPNGSQQTLWQTWLLHTKPGTADWEVHNGC